MNKVVKVAILGSTGYVGMELIDILVKHPHIKINFLGSENLRIQHRFDKKKKYSKLPSLTLNKDFDPKKSDAVFLALPHGISQQYVKEYFDKISIFDLMNVNLYNLEIIL